MAYHTKTLKVKYEDFQHPNMADVWVAKLAAEQGIFIMVAAHKDKYVKQIPFKDTIYNTHVYDCDMQTKIVNTFL